MIKKTVLVVLLGILFGGIRADDVYEVHELLQQVDLVLFVLQRNTLRMERYGLSELDSDVNILSRDISDEHSLLKISMTEPNSRAHLLSWDQDQTRRLKITAGRKRNPINYYLILDKLVDFDTSLNDLAMIRFDCSVQHSKILKDVESTTKKLAWKSMVHIAVSAGDEDLSTQLVLDGRVDAACGFFVQRDLFCDKLCVTGRIKRQDAIEQGVLIAEMPSVIQVNDGIESEPFESQESKSVFEKIKGKVLAKLAVVLHFIDDSWKKIWALFI